MPSIKSIYFVGLFLINTFCFSGVLDVLDGSKCSNLYVFNKNLIYNGSVNRLLCAYKEGAERSIAFTDISKLELDDMLRNNVNLVYFAPQFDLSDSSSERNSKTQQLLSYLDAYGMSAWVDVLGVNLYPVKASDASVINDMSTAQAWMDAVATLDDDASKNLLDLARVWDIRLELILQKRISAWGNFFCEASGVRVVDNPIFGIWSFESNWLDRMLEGDWRELPEFFVKQLTTEWNNWVYNEITQSTEDFKKKYVFLVKGESVEKGTLKLVALSQHKNVAENDSWITLGDKTRKIYEKTQRSSLQREFFIQLYLKHISALKEKFVALGSVTRDAPYFITMSAKDNANMSLTDIYFGSQNIPYVYRYLGVGADKNTSFADGKAFFDNNLDVKGASIVMVPYSLLQETSPHTLGVVHSAFSVHPSAVNEFNIEASKQTIKEASFGMNFVDATTNVIDGITFQLVDRTPLELVTNVVDGVEVVKEQPVDNSSFNLSVKYLKIDRTRFNQPISHVYLFLDYDVSKAEHFQLHIHGKPIANFSLEGKLFDESIKQPKYHSLDKRGAVKLSLKNGYSILFLERNPQEFKLPLDF